MSEDIFGRRLPFRAEVTGVAVGSIQRGDIVTASFDYGQSFECEDCGEHPTTVVREGLPSEEGYSCLGYGFAGWDAEEGETIVVYGDRGRIRDVE